MESNIQEKEWINYLLSKPCSEDSFPFGPEAHVFKVFGKMFALIGYRDEQLAITLKAKPEDVTFLTEEFKGIERGYHMSKKHWITIRSSKDFTSSMLESWIDNSYDLVVSKLTKSEKTKIKE